MSVTEYKVIHCVGIGGISVSAIAKLLQARGVRVSGSDVEANEQIEQLQARGIPISIGHTVDVLPQDVECIVYSVAVPASNPERQAARKRGIPEYTNSQFLGELTKDKKVILVCGTHGKSTTTAMLGLMAERAGLDPTVFVGSQVPSFAEGNLRIGASDLYIIEGDEYAKHFLDFSPYGIVINNIEHDHPDIFPRLEDVRSAFDELCTRVRPGGVIVANMADSGVAQLLKEQARSDVRIIRCGGPSDEACRVVRSHSEKSQEFTLFKGSTTYRFILAVPGEFNVFNAAGAALMALELGISYEDIATALQSFKGIWRRFELLQEYRGAYIISDYAHHPTAVAATIKAAKEVFPLSRLVVCFQPHHRKRTKELFFEFVSAFDGVDVLVLCEIYDVIGREAEEDATISAQDLKDALVRHDADRGVERQVEFVQTPQEAVERIKTIAAPKDVIIMMGAGNIDAAARKI